MPWCVFINKAYWQQSSGWMHSSFIGFRSDPDLDQKVFYQVNLAVPSLTNGCRQLLRTGPLSLVCHPSCTASSLSSSSPRSVHSFRLLSSPPSLPPYFLPSLLRSLCSPPSMSDFVLSASVVFHTRLPSLSCPLASGTSGGRL